MTTTITNSNLRATINNLGAELVSLKDKTNKEYLWEGNPAHWGKHSPILFPIVGSLKNDSYHHNEMEYHLSRHGFARKMEFNLVDVNENSVTFSLQSSADTLKNYPFEFELQLIYTLQENRLSIEYKVINTGNVKMPFSIGGHPAFALARNFENYSIEFEQDEPLVYNLLANNLITPATKVLESQNKLVPLKYQLFENDALIFKSLQSNSITILENSNPLLKVDFADFPHLGIWTKMNAPFLCIEPWFGYSDSTESTSNLFEKEGIQILEANQNFISEFSVEIL